MSGKETQPLFDEEKAQDWLDSLPTVGEGQTFCFECNPDMPCFNRCCRQLTLPLTPYDVMRLCRRLGMKSDVFLDNFAKLKTFPDSGLPIVMLNMLKDPDETCPFVTPAGCHVYEDRPSACRSYPLGRGTQLSRNGVSETLRLNESSKLLLLKKVGDPLGLPTPDYVPSKGILKSAGVLLKECGSAVSAQVFNQKMIEAGMMEDLARPSSHGKVKYFKSIKGKGLDFGENQVNPNNPKETQPQYYEVKFPELLQILKIG